MHTIPARWLSLPLLLSLSLGTGCAGDDPGTGASDSGSDSGSDAPSGSDGGDDEGGGDTSATDSGGAADSGAADVATWDDARPIIEARCSRCHSANRLSTYRRLETHADVSQLRGSILDKISATPPRGQRMPLASNHEGAGGCTPTHAQVDDKRLTADEAATLSAYLQRTDHLEYEDTHPPLAAPEVPVLADAVTLTSSEYEVLNDGFLTHPDGESDDYMEEYGYDERDYDQMEDDWFCIRFDPARTDPGYLTGMQVETASGQIYLNSQLVIDTTGASAAAQAAADEKGADWYRCDAGLGFSDAVPLWRTVPGGAPVELPEATGLRFEPGWTFVLRADFHTHYDAEEFERLEQDGVIDREAGTMTWFDQATLRTRWAAPEEITRELGVVMLGPDGEAERDAFAVVPGTSSLRYTTALPDAAERYAVFSAELGMGKHGHTASLVDVGSSTCIANNGDFSPKWIEQAIYAEADAPEVDGGGTLALQCDYDNDTDESVAWGVEGEATVWGRKERCSGVVFLYEAR